jgi:CRP/FNR family transcriptional regulator
LETLSADFPSLRHRLAAAMSQSMAHDDAMHRMLSTWRADQRLASFLWQLANRRRRLDLGAVTFRLPLQRQELATHLGVSKETISRTMRHLEQSGCLRLRNRTVTILDLNTLQQIAGALEVEPHSGRTSPKRA